MDATLVALTARAPSAAGERPGQKAVDSARKRGARCAGSRAARGRRSSGLQFGATRPARRRARHTAATRHLREGPRHHRRRAPGDVPARARLGQLRAAPPPRRTVLPDVLHERGVPERARGPRRSLLPEGTRQRALVRSGGHAGEHDARPVDVRCAGGRRVPSGCTTSSSRSTSPQRFRASSFPSTS